MRIALLLLVCLGGCSAGIGELEKRAPEAVNEQSLIRPPWQALVKAGAGAGKDIDLETLDGPQAAASVAPALQPSAKPTDPNATEIKSVAVFGIEGSPGRGNRDLTAAMIKVMKGAGWPTVAAPRKDALIISAHASLDDASGPNQTVHLTWKVTSPKGRVLGSVTQNNAVPSHSLDATWGDSADAAAQAAADGIFRLIAQYR